MRTCSSDRGLLCPIALIPATDLRTIVAPESVYGVAGADRCEPPARPSAPRIAPPATLTTLTRKAHPRKLARLLVSVAFLTILLVGPEAFSLSPQINTLSPNSGITSTSVTIAGTNFGSSQGSSTVTFNGALAPNPVWGASSIAVNVPSAATTGNVVVTVGGVQSNGVPFTVLPHVTSISPTSGPTGSPLEVYGTGFGNSVGSLTINSVAATPTFWSDTKVICEVPATAGTGPVVVTVGGNSSNNNVVFTLAVNGSISGTVSNVANGAGISGATVSLYLAGVLQTSTTSGTGGAYSLSNLPTGNYSLGIAASGFSTTTVGSVPVNAGGTTTENVPLSTPNIAALTPSSGPVGTVVVISGSYFGALPASNAVAFNGTAATPTLWSNTTITVPVPTGAKTGAVIVTVGGAASNGVTFKVGAGKISGTITQSSNGSVVSGASIKAYQLGVSKRSTTSAADGTYTLGSLTPGSYDVLVSSSALATTIVSGIPATAGTTTTQNFSLSSTPGAIAGNVTQSNGTTVVSGATVNALQGYTVAASTTTDTSGNYTLGSLAAGNYVVTVTATGFKAQTNNGVTVAAGSTATANFSLPSQDAITYVYDQTNRLAGVVDALGNTAVYNYDTAGNILGISQNASSSISIIEFTPTSGPIGSTVTLNGTGFSTTKVNNKVKFNGVAATITSATATTLVTSVPATATTGKISVTSPAGTATSSSSFIVTSSNGLPTITSFTPTIGVSGTAVTITGTNFDTNTTNDNPKFNLTSAQLSSATATTIGASVPISVASGRISVSTAVGQTVSTQDFFIPFGTHIATDVGPTGRMLLNSTQPVSIGTAGKIGLMLFDGTAGQKFSLFANNSSFSSCSLLVLDPYGRQLTSMTCTGTGQFSGEQTLAYTGTYTIGIDPGSATGSVSINLNGFSDQTGVLIPGVPVNIKTSYPGQRAIYSFSGTAGQVVSLAMTNSTYSGDCPNVSIRNPNGTTLASTTICGGSSSSLSNETLPTTGTYTVLVNPGVATGGYTYTLTQNITQSLPFNSPLTVSSALAGQSFDLTFSGTAAQQVVSLVITNNSYPCGGPPLFYGNLNVSILKPDGTTLVSDNALCGSDSLNNVNLPTTGTYTVLVNPGATTGGVTFTLTPNITEPIVFNTPLSVSSSLAGQVFDLTFSGTAAQVVSLVITNNSYPCGGPPLFYGNLNVSILKPDGTTLVSDNALCGSGSLNNVSLPTTGTYTVLVNPKMTTGGATFDLTSP